MSSVSSRAASAPCEPSNSWGIPIFRWTSRVGRLSVAEQQIVEIARALGSGCRVLVLDEPTSSLTATDTERLFGVIAGLRASGLGIVYISHFLEEVKRIADRITVLRDGKVVGGGISAGLRSKRSSG